MHFKKGPDASTQALGPFEKHERGRVRYMRHVPISLLFLGRVVSLVFISFHFIVNIFVKFLFDGYIFIVIGP